MFLIVRLVPHITYFDVSAAIYIHDILHNDCLKYVDVNGGSDC